jgi:hypothetical protein
MSILLYDTELKMRYSRELDHPCTLQFDLLGAQMIEQSDSVAEEYGDKVDLQFIE